MSRVRSFFLIVCCAAVLTVAACGGDATGPGASVQVTPGSATLVSLEETVQLTATGSGGSGDPISAAAFTWSSSNASVVAVDPTGLATAVSNGQATVTATAEGAQGTVTLTVAQAVASVEVTPSSATLESIGETLQLTGAASDARGNTIAGTQFSWASTDATVVTVDATGLVTAVGDGQATVTATADGVDASSGLTVQSLVGDWTLSGGQRSGVTIAGLTASLALRADLSYDASFSDGVNTGTATGSYSVTNDSFESNLGAFVLNGTTSSFTVVDGQFVTLWSTTMNTSSTAFTNYGKTAIGFSSGGTITISISGSTLTLTQGATTLSYARD